MQPSEDISEMPLQERREALSAVWLISRTEAKSAQYTTRLLASVSACPFLAMLRAFALEALSFFRGTFSHDAEDGSDLFPDFHPSAVYQPPPITDPAVATYNIADDLFNGFAVHQYPPIGVI